jgi:hypothetical protein
MIPIKNCSSKELWSDRGIIHSENNFIMDRFKRLKINIGIIIGQNLLEGKA